MSRANRATTKGVGNDQWVGSRAAELLLAVPLVASMLVSIIRGSRHFAWDWPVHAHHHLVAHIATSVGVCVVALVVLFVPLRRGERWAWWALALTGIAVFGSYWLGNLTVGLGIDAVVPNTAQAVLTLAYAGGLARAWAALRRREPLVSTEGGGASQRWPHPS